MSLAARTAVALVAALLVPGLGHVALGRRRLGAAFFAIVAATWSVGLLLGGRLPQVQPGSALSLVAAAAGWGAGLLSLASRLAGLVSGTLRNPMVEYGTTYLMTASVMNLLLLLDTWERARGQKP